MAEDKKDPVSTQEAAKLLNVKDATTVRQAIRRGSLKAHKVGRDWFIEIEDLKLYIKNKKENWRK